MFSKIIRGAAIFSFIVTFALLEGEAMAAGALAIDSNQGDQYGFSYGQPGRSQAVQRALNECGAGCRIVLDFNSGCGAFAADQSRGSSAHGWGTASSGSAAQNRAVAECQARGGTNCTIRAWGCN